VVESIEQRIGSGGRAVRAKTDRNHSRAGDNGRSQLRAVFDEIGEIGRQLGQPEVKGAVVERRTTQTPEVLGHARSLFRVRNREDAAGRR
jgi:hypothetical protein